MPREANLFEQAGGSALEGYFMLKASGGNMPPRWIDNAGASRKGRHKGVAQALKKANWGDITTLRDWEEAYEKECFYNGIRILFELERDGKPNR
jgi:hypothetical protein